MIYELLIRCLEIGTDPLPPPPPHPISGSWNFCGGLATGLEALLRAGYAISSYAWVDIDPDAHTVASHRIACLRHQFPHLLPPEAIKDWDCRLPMDVPTISPELLNATFPVGIDLILASPPVIVARLFSSNIDHTPSTGSGPRPTHHTTCPPPFRVATTRGRIYMDLFRALSAIRKHLVTTRARDPTRRLKMRLGSLP
jgi:hypothetical protein